MSYEQRPSWDRDGGSRDSAGGYGGSSDGGRGPGRAGGGGGGRGGRGRHPGHLKGREIGLWYAKKQGQKNKEAERREVSGRGPGAPLGLAARARPPSARPPARPRVWVGGVGRPVHRRPIPGALSVLPPGLLRGSCVERAIEPGSAACSSSAFPAARWLLPQACYCRARQFCAVPGTSPWSPHSLTYYTPPSPLLSFTLRSSIL